MKQIIYIVASESKSIEVWKLSKKGKMSLIQIVNTEKKQGQPLKISKKNNKLYIGVKPDFNILIYNILKDGRLKKYNSIKIPYSPNYISVYNKEKFLFCSHYHDNCMSINKINEANYCDSDIKVISKIQGCHSTNVDLYNKLIYIPALLEDKIYLYNIDNLKKNKFSNKLKYVKCDKNSGPRHIALHNNKKYLYSINELNGTIDVWRIEKEKKNIERIQNISISKISTLYRKYWSSDIHLTSCGKYLYASDRLSNTISAFKINSDSKLSIINEYNTSTQPRSFNIDKYNKYLISAGQLSNTITIHKISKNKGTLKKIKEYKVGKNPIWVGI